MSDGAWASVVKTVPNRLAKSGSWPAVSRAWFSPALPTGTVYGLDWRVDEGGSLPALDCPR